MMWIIPTIYMLLIYKDIAVINIFLASVIFFQNKEVKFVSFFVFFCQFCSNFFSFLNMLYKVLCFLLTAFLTRPTVYPTVI